MNDIVSNQIIRLRKEHKLTQQALAERMNVSTAAVCKWETGASIPDINTLCSLADFFKVSVDYILGREIQKKKCVVFCCQKEYKNEIESCLQNKEIVIQAYTYSMPELEIYLKNTLEFVPVVISFSTGEKIDTHSEILSKLKEQYGFKLFIIKSSTADEFGDILELYLNNFKWK